VVTGVADPDTTPPVPAKDAGKDDEEPKRRKSESANETSRRQSILYRFRKTGRRESPEKFAARMKELQAGVQKPAEEQEE